MFVGVQLNLTNRHLIWKSLQEV